MLKLCDVYLNKLYKNQEYFQIENDGRVFDLPRYVVLYYFEKIIESQLGKNFDLKEGIIIVNNKIDEHLMRKYPKSKLIKNIKNIPINSNNIDFIIPKKKSIFDKFTHKTDDFNIEEAENALFKNKNYFIKYIELNSNIDMDEFELMIKIPLCVLTKNIDQILQTIKLQTFEVLKTTTSEINKFDKTRNLSLFMKEYIKDYFETELEKYILNDKLKLIESETEKAKNLDIENLNNLIKTKESDLDSIQNKMKDLTFYDIELKNKIDKSIENNIYKVYDDIPYNLDLSQAVNLIGENLFLDLINNTISVIYQELKYD